MISKKWEELKKEVLGEEFELSVVFANDELMEQLNTKYRNKPKSTTVLSFLLSENLGEIFVNRPLVEKEAESVGEEKERYMDYLFIHSLLHLKGYEHSDEMKEEEEKILNNL